MSGLCKNEILSFAAKKINFFEKDVWQHNLFHYDAHFFIIIPFQFQSVHMHEKRIMSNTYLQYRTVKIIKTEIKKP